MATHLDVASRRIIRELAAHNPDLADVVWKPTESTVEIQQPRYTIRATEVEIKRLIQMAYITPAASSPAGGVRVVLMQRGIDDAALNFGLSPRDEVLAVLYEAGKDNISQAISGTQVQNESAMDRGRVHAGLSRLGRDLCIKRASSTSFATPTDPVLDLWRLTDKGIEEYYHPTPAAPAISHVDNSTTTNYVVKAIGGNAQQAIGSHVTATQGIDAAAMEKFIAATIEFVKAARDAGSDELAAKVEDAAKDLADGKPDVIETTSKVVKLVGDIFDTIGKGAEAIGKAAEVVTKAGLWLTAVHATLRLIQ